MMVTDNPNEIYNLCLSNAELYRKLQLNPNSEYWKKLYKQKYGIYPDQIPNLSFKDQYQTLYHLDEDEYAGLRHTGMKHTDFYFNALQKISILAEKGMLTVLENCLSSCYPLGSKRDLINCSMVNAVKSGCITLIQKMIDLGADDFSGTFLNAAIVGNIDILQMLSKYYNKKLNKLDYHKAMKCAAENGHLEVIQLMIDKGVNSYSFSVVAAAARGQLNIIQWFLDMYADKISKDYYDKAIKSATDGQIIWNKQKTRSIDDRFSVKKYNDIIKLLKRHKYMIYS